MKFWISADITVPVEIEVNIDPGDFEGKTVDQVLSEAVRVHLNLTLQAGPDDRVRQVIDVDVRTFTDL